MEDVRRTNTRRRLKGRLASRRVSDMQVGLDVAST